MTAPINRLIDSVCRCTICGGPVGCGCWVRSTLRCPHCSRSVVRLERAGSSAPANEVHPCPECAAKVKCQKCDGPLSDVASDVFCGKDECIA